MKKNKPYIKHQAFNTVYEELIDNSKTATADFDAPKKYHHAPDKLDIFKHYIAYFKWSSELFTASSKLSHLLRNMYSESRTASSSWYRNKDELNNILKEFNNLSINLQNFYDDVFEFQNCMLATSISEKYSQLEPLSNQVQHLTTLENKIIETCNRKLYEISSARVTCTSIFIAFVALLISTLSLYYSQADMLLQDIISDWFNYL